MARIDEVPLPEPVEGDYVDLFEPDAYIPEWDQEAHTLYDIIKKAEAAGVPDEQIDRLNADYIPGGDNEKVI